MTVVHMIKGNRNFAKETFKALCSSKPIPYKYSSQDLNGSYSLEKINCEQCLMILLSLKENEINIIENKLKLRSLK